MGGVDRWGGGVDRCNYYTLEIKLLQKINVRTEVNDRKQNSRFEKSKVKDQVMNRLPKQPSW